LGFSAAGSGMASARFANRVNEQILAKAVGIIFIILGIIMSWIQLVSAID
jgi:putative Ca2+/H+ antiporter (TMEM165/GDT1 family)